MAYEKELNEANKYRVIMNHKNDRRCKEYKSAEAEINKIHNAIALDYATKLFNEYKEAGIFDSMNFKDMQFNFIKGIYSFSFVVHIHTWNDTSTIFGNFVNSFGRFNRTTCELLAVNDVKKYVEDTIIEKEKSNNEKEARKKLLNEFAESVKDDIVPEDLKYIKSGFRNEIRYSKDGYDIPNANRNIYVRMEARSENNNELSVSFDLRNRLPFEKALEFWLEVRKLRDKFCS